MKEKMGEIGMPDLKNSEMLQKIMDHVKFLFPDSTITTERFFASLLDTLLSEGTDDAELREAKEILGKGGTVLANIRNKLLSSRAGAKKPGLADMLYFQEKVYKAKSQAWIDDEKQLKVGHVLKIIMPDLSDFLNVSGEFAEERKETGESDVPIDDLSESIKEEGSEEEIDDLDVLINGLRALIEKDEDCESENQSDKELGADDDDVQKGTDKTYGLSELVSEVKRVGGALRKVIYGQDNAVSAFVTGYFQACMQSFLEPDGRRPRATFLFAGPPGVGKTFLAETAAKELQLPFKRFDMSEYADKEANLEFCGSDQVYKSAKEGNVTGYVAKHPKCVLIFDEIEKAHICVIHLFLQILDAGRLRDNFTDEEVSFSETIIIFTTNAGRQLYEGSEGKDLSSVSRKVILRALQKDVDPSTNVPYFPPAICSRFASGNVIMFNHMNARSLYMVAKNQLDKQAKRFSEKTGIKTEVDALVYTALLLSEGGKADARTIRSRAELFFNNELYELFRLIGSKKTKSDIKDIKRIRIGADLSRADGQVSALFVSPREPHILVFAGEEKVSLCRNAVKQDKVFGAQDGETALKCIREQDIDFVLLDYGYGIGDAKLLSLNIEDADSAARDFFKLLRAKKNDLPVYLLEEDKALLSAEEKVSFMRQGIYGFVRIDRTARTLHNALYEIAKDIHRQESLIKLEKENKLISFETAQAISADGGEAKIMLFDFHSEVALDSEDAGNVLSPSKKPNLFFRDVIGGEEAKKELSYFVEYLKNPKKYLGTGLKAPKGVLLYGPPGTGKTMLAKAMAREADVTFIATEGNAFLKKYVGEGSEKVHEIFRLARKYAPTVLFIDEVDAIARERKGDASNNAGGEGTLTAFLTEMDGFVNDPSRPVFVLAATNFEVEQGNERSLDAALLRRFDRRIYLDLPGKQDRVRFLKLTAAKNPAIQISEEKIENIAMRSTGMSLAEIESAVELALRSAVREGGSVVNDDIFEEAFETFNGGEKKKWDESQLERVARHEAGHALLCWLGGETPSYLTVVARRGHGGYMQHADREGKEIYTKEELLGRVRTALGGRAAEIVFYGEEEGLSTGASGDLASATSLVRRMVCVFGMEESFGLAVSDDASGSISSEVKVIINRILKEQMEESVRLISENRNKIDALVRELLVKNHLNGTQIDEILGAR